jgi:competence protein ComEA
MFEPPVPPRPEPRRRLPSAPSLERLREQWEDPRVRVGALLLAALVAGFFWYQLGVRGSTAAAPPPPTTTSSGARSRAAASPEASSRPSGRVVVQVAGAVAHPGVVRVSADARVIDAVHAAGGGLPGADLDRLNLAAKVVDGQRIAVALVGQPAPAESGAGATTDGAAGDGTTSGPININTATATQLEELPGIGPSLAAAIIKEREKRGGFKAVGELQDVRGIGELRFADIKDLVSV